MSSEQRKVLEDIQRAKRLLKEGAAASLGMHTPTTITPPMSTTASGFSNQPPAVIGDIMMSPIMRSAMQVLSSANSTSFGFFVPQDSHFGNSILPVLPRIEPPSSTSGQLPTPTSSGSGTE